MCKEFLSNLTESERKILKERFGIDINEGDNINELIQKYNITREKIRAIEKRALNKLRGDNDPDAA